MPIASSDLIYHASAPTASAGNTTAMTTPGGSLGKYMSTSAITTATMDNLFPDVTGDENAADNLDYQCMFLLNNNGTLTLQSPVIWLYSEVAGGVNTAIATDNIGASAKGASGVQAAVIANKNTAPTSVSAFSSPTTQGAGLSLANIAPGQVVGIWVRRTSTNSAALSNDGVTLRVSGESTS